MNNREDYLDRLLNAVSNPKEEEAGLHMQEADDDLLNGKNTDDEFLKKFDQEMADLDETSFLEEFEQGLDEGEEELEPLEQETKNAPYDSDSIMVNTFDDEFEQESDIQLPELEPEAFDNGEMDFSASSEEGMDLDTLLSAAMGKPIEEKGDESEGAVAVEEPVAEKEPELEKEPDSMEEGQDILDILSGLDPDDDLKNIGDLLKAQDGDEKVPEGDSEDFSDDFAAEMGKIDELTGSEDGLSQDNEGETSKKKKRKKGKNKTSETGEEKTGFFHRVSKTFFGDDTAEEDPEALKALEQENKKVKRQEQQEKKEQKKKDKEEKKKEQEEKKKEKEQAKEEKKSQKPKKVKQPKEKLKPLPRVPVILIFVMGFSIVILVNLFSGLVGYSTGVELAKDYYSRGNYVEAYGALSGMNIKDVDKGFYERARLTAMIQKDWNSYEAYLKAEMYPEALNALICGVGRYDDNIEAAREANVGNEYDAMVVEFQEALKQQFSVSVEMAREMYAQDTRKDYSVQLYKILDQTGL